MKKKVITKDLINTIESLSHLEVDKQEEEYFVEQFNETLGVIDELNQLDTRGIAETNQVTGLVNVVREDVIDSTNILSQKQALSGAKRTHKGYFVVDAIFENKL